MTWTTRVAPLFLILAPACKDVEDPDDHTHEENEVITTVILAFAPTGGGAAKEYAWADPENDGSPSIDDISLVDAEDYAVTVRFLNELEDPAEEITEEVSEESDHHQVFFTGSAVAGPASDNAAAVVEHAYADVDADGLPVGLSNTFTTLGVGSGDLVVTLRHLPPEDDEPVKVAGAAEEVAAGGFGAIGGDNDAQVTFSLAVD